MIKTKPYMNMNETLETEKKVFTDIREAFDYLVNVAWDELSPEQHKILRVPKSDFNHGSISYQRMEKILAEFGRLKKNIEFELK